MNYGNSNLLEPDYTGEEKVIRYVSTKNSHTSPFTIFDAGANTGSYSLQLEKILRHRSTRIYAFEPSRFSYPQLVEKTAGLMNIQCFNFGLGRVEEDLTLYSNFEGSGAATLYGSGFSIYNTNKNLKEEIHLKTLDEFCKTNMIGNIDFLKIDVEGHELFVLEGATMMLQTGKIKFIQFEFGPFHVYSRTFFKDFWDMLSPYYKISRIIADGLFEIKAYTENLEVFRTANFLAELKEHLPLLGVVTNKEFKNEIINIE